MINAGTRSFALGSLAQGRPALEFIDLGPNHPSRAGLVTLRATIDNQLVTALDVHPGTLHRGAEMLFEVRDYRQALSLANRHDWRAPFFGELLLARLVEDSLGVTVPDRAQWLRCLLAEHFRIGSHLAYLGYLEFRAGEKPQSTQLTERVLEQNLALTGNRVHPMAVRLGGLAVDSTAEWLAAELELLAEVDTVADGLRALLDSQASDPLRNLAVTPLELVDQFGLTGPVSAAAGVDRDLRHADWFPAGLGDVLLPLVLGEAGDAWSRFAVLIAQLKQSAVIIRALIDTLPAGPVEVKLPKVVRVPEGDHYAAVEAPWGHAGMFLVSRGEKTPWRLKLCTPGFTIVNSWSAALIGTPAARLADALASLPYVTGDLDK